MRLADITNPQDGNKFLVEVFLPKFNQQFAVVPAKQGNVHRALRNEENEILNHTFSIHETRRVNNDFTIQFKNHWYQLTEIQSTTVRPQEVVLVETWLNDSVHLLLKEHELNYALLPKKPKKQRIIQPIILTTHTLNYKPPSNHPWKLYAKAGKELKK